MKKEILKNRKCGFVLSEVLLAGAIITFAVGNTFIVLGSIQTVLINSKNSFEAQLLIDREIALLQLQKFHDLKSYNKNFENFSLFAKIDNRNSYTTNITFDVSWQSGLNVKHKILTKQIIDWKNADVSQECDWLDESRGNLTKVNSLILNIEDGNEITDIISSGDYVYISTDSATSSLPDLYVIDVKDISNPAIISKLNTGPGISKIVLSDKYIFVANAGSYQLQIISVADPTHPVLISQAKLPGSIISGSSGFGRSIHYFDKKIYIGLIKNNGPELYIVDVNNPSAPIFLGSVEVNSTVNDIEAQSGRAIVATPGSSSVILFDIKDPQNIVQESFFSFTGWTTQGAQSIEVLGSTAVVGRTLGGFYSPYPELALLNIENDNFTLSSSSIKMNSSIQKIFRFNDFLYVGTTDVSKGFQIMQIPATSSENLNIISTFDLPTRVVSLSCNSQAFYVVTQDNNNFLHIYK